MGIKVINSPTTEISCDHKGCTRSVTLEMDKREAMKMAEKFGWECVDDTRGPMSSGWEWYYCPEHKQKR